MRPRNLFYATAALTALALPANAAVMDNLGVNPNSTTGAFSSIDFGGAGGDGSGPFRDQILFELQGGPAFLTIASATNVHPNTSDFITNFTGGVFFAGADGVPGGGDDVQVIGPVLATACPITPSCQGFSGSTLLTIVGDYYLNLSGIGGGTSGYGGNLAVAQVPIPGALALFATGLVGLGLLSKKRKKNATVA